MNICQELSIHHPALLPCQTPSHNCPHAALSISSLYRTASMCIRGRCGTVCGGCAYYWVCVKQVELYIEPDELPQWKPLSSLQMIDGVLFIVKIVYCNTFYVFWFGLSCLYFPLSFNVLFYLKLFSIRSRTAKLLYLLNGVFTTSFQFSLTHLLHTHSHTKTKSDPYKSIIFVL